MTQARRKQISLDDTPYYHCIARCVRRAFLCGADPYSGNCYEHRRQWVLNRLRQLSAVFAIDVCAYAVLHNHFHLVLRVDQAEARSWNLEAIIRRWHALFRGDSLSQRFIQDAALSEAELDAVRERAEIWRDRLMNISWFMKELNEYIARQANLEDRCTGRFWESRFKSQALLDNTAVLACMAYVDLNPIRAGIADSMLTSDFTSVQERLVQLNESIKPAAKVSNHLATKTNLLPFIEAEHVLNPEKALPFTLKDYLDLVDYTGRVVRSDKRGAINRRTPRLFDQLGLDDEQWHLLSIDIQKQSLSALGSLEQLEIYHASIDKRWMPKQNYLRWCYTKAG